MQAYKAFIFMFYALDAVYDEEPKEALGRYLSGLNPFLFKGEGSADPAEYIEFEKAYTEFFEEREAEFMDVYNFCQKYLQKNAPEEVAAAFKQISKEDWVTAFEAN